MKYGASLRAHSIPAWAHHNIDYDEIKHFIKEHTTPGNGTTISIPGTGDTRGQEIEDSLFDILFEQHKRINMFVRSKAGEIQRRLDHLDKQTNRLRSRPPATQQTRMTAKLLESYGQLESDVLRAGEELRSLSRFITAQQTAFRKLIKKHKKWSKTSGLELRFTKEVLGDVTSFAKVDLEPMLLEWEEILDAVRALYQERMNGASAAPDPITTTKSQQPVSTQAAIEELRSVAQSNSHTSFDAFFASLPLGDHGKNAVYWVHPENVVQLQILLLQHSRSHAVYRHTPPATPYGTLSRQNSHSGTSPTRRGLSAVDPDTGLLIIDDLERFVKQQNSTTLEARENAVGARLQNAILAARWTQEDEAIVTVQLDGGKVVKNTSVKRKHLAAAINPVSTIPARKASISDDAVQSVEELRSWCANNKQNQPLVTMTSSRQRFHDIAADSSGFLMATLDKNISMKPSTMSDFSFLDCHPKSTGVIAFPHAVLRIRQEGSHTSNLLHVLDSSHLVERVRGFSLEYHAVWHCCQPANTVAPFWIPLLQKDIRKLPKSVGWGRRDNTVSSNMGSQATTPNMSVANTSESGHGDTTAVEEQPDNGHITILDELQAPRLGSANKKRTGSYHARALPKQKYWSEYDNPSDGEDEDAYVLFIDPDAESGFSQAWQNLVGIFTPKSSKAGKRDPLLGRNDSIDSSDEETRIGSRHSYGTIATTSTSNGSPNRTFWLPAITMTCLGASIAIMVVGYLLAMTGRKKQYQEVDAGIVFAVVSSLLFAISGVATMFGPGAGTIWTARLIALTVLAVDAIASGALLAWILG